MVISHLPDGPTAHFKMSSVKLATEIKVSHLVCVHEREDERLAIWKYLARAFKKNISINYTLSYNENYTFRRFDGGF